MRLVSPLLKRVVYPALHRTGWLDHISPPGFAVVNYHGLIPSDHTQEDYFLDGNLVQPEVFRRQLQFLKARYNIIQPDDFRAWIELGKPIPESAILLTCDDGLLNTLDMLPVLQSEGVQCIFFVTGASASENPSTLWYEELYYWMRRARSQGLQMQIPAGERPISPPQDIQSQWWDTLRRASQLDAATRAEWMNRERAHFDSRNASAPETHSEKRYRLLKKSELEQFVDAGMTIGGHTMTHPILSVCSEAEARREIIESKTCLEQATGQPVWAFAYPFGNPATVGEREFLFAREAGFSASFLNVEHWNVQPAKVERRASAGRNEGRVNSSAIPRTHVSSETTIPELAAHVSGVHNRLQRVFGSKP